MPELPEVETVRRGLETLLAGQKITAVSSDWEKSFPNSDSDVTRFLIGATVVDIRRRAKVLLIDLDTEYSLVIHLKMTGQLVFVANNEDRWGAGHPNDSLIGNLPDKSTRVIFWLSDPIDKKISIAQGANARKNRSIKPAGQEVQLASTGGFDTAEVPERWRSFGLRPKAGQSGACLFFNDQRKFGWVRLMPTIAIPELDFFKKVGPEPLDADFTSDMFINAIRRRQNSNIKAVLLDQTVIAGVGNIYADESLWGARIHPTTLVKQLTDMQLTKLFKELVYVLKLAIEKGGSTDKNYVNAEGKRGSYMSFARVFRRENQPCPRCGTIIEKTRVAGRGTHICQKCQKPLLQS